MEFQSTPLVAERRCLQAPCRRGSARTSFNPRPSLPRGDAVCGGGGRRCIRRFNPRPSLPRGDAAHRAGCVDCDNVSIHAPHCREAMPHNGQNNGIADLFQSTPLVAERRCNKGHVGQLYQAGFNPRPSLPRGDAVSAEQADYQMTVSIHAPRCREAMHGRPARRPTKIRFQSTPLVAERRCIRPCLYMPGQSRFQSTPLVAERRCGPEIKLHLRFPSFNPRPSLPRGDAGKVRVFIRPIHVSIHAPRCREAMP
ncbi:MAG: hypothetical protein RLZZ298_474 [Pseudomonadota bacterium]